MEVEEVSPINLLQFDTAGLWVPVEEAWRTSGNWSSEFMEGMVGLERNIVCGLKSRVSKLQGQC